MAELRPLPAIAAPTNTKLALTTRCRRWRTASFGLSSFASWRGSP